MSNKLHYVQSQIEMAEDIPHGGSVRVHVLVSARVMFIKVQDEEQQLPKPSLIKHAHQICKRKAITIWNMFVLTRFSGRMQGYSRPLPACWKSKIYMKIYYI